MTHREPPQRLAGPIGVSALLHVAVLALLVFAKAGSRAPVMPPTYRVDLVAAPPGPRAIGEVAPTPKPQTPAPEKPPPAPPKRAEVKPSDMPAPVTKPRERTPPAPATPTPATQAPPKNAPATRAGGGPTGGRGTDVATVRTEGINFPFPGYLENIVRQIALNFKPRNPGSALRAEIFFMIQRDGSVTGIRYITRSGSYEFDLEARGAIEAAASARAFGALPEGFGEPVLPVIFSFDPSLLR